ncbi:MAG: glycoside hydrolase family 2 TIM barrel-domain containing protein [Bacillota bacterium]|nr:glycoside hydrolase family 2 TIM barrel-domain containing protein [Bacillota bacterium]
MKTISLNGIWDFCIDHDKVGEADEFLNSKYCFGDRLAVPGSWRLENKYRDFVGCGWYRTTFTVPPRYIGKHLEIRFGGVFRYANVFLNGQKVKQHEGFQSAFSADISSIAKAGKNILAVKADSKRDDSFDITGGASVFDMNTTLIAGIYESVAFEMSELVRVTDIYAPLDLPAGLVRLLFTAQNDSINAAKAEFRITITGAENEIVARRTITKLIDVGESCYEECFNAEQFDLWSPESPTLYNIELTLSANGYEDSICRRVGFKHLEARGRDFWLNGKPYYLLGYGDDFVFPLDGLPDATKSEYYYHGIRRSKEYGFNMVRHHSHFPFEAYLDAADELGILIQPELALANIIISRFNDANKKLFLSEWRDLIKEKRSHPCIMAWCGGNEMEWGFPFEEELYSTAKELDPYRLTTTTDGNFMACDVGKYHDYSSICPAEYTDFLPYGELNDMFLRDDSGKPQIVHEMGNYTTMPDISLVERFENALIKQPYLENFAVIDGELRGLYERAHKSSFSLQKLCHKLNIEKARLSPYFCGYHVWTLIDYYNTTQGVLNQFYEDKAFTAKEFSQINNQCVLLWDTDSYLHRAGEEMVFRILLSRFGEDGPFSGKLTLSLSEGKSHIIHIEFSGHGLIPMVEWKTDLPRENSVKKYILSVMLDSLEMKLENEWCFWAFPKLEFDSDKEIYIHYLSRFLFKEYIYPIKHFTIPLPLCEKHVLVTSYLYNGMLEAVQNGSVLLLLAKADTFQETRTQNSFKTPWWEQKRIWYLNHSNNEQITGIVEHHPAMPFAGEDCWEYPLFELVEQAPAVDIDELGLDVSPIVYGIDYRLHRRAYLFEFRLGKGGVLISTLNMDRHNISSPNVDYLFKHLVNYCMSDSFSPNKTLSIDQLNATLK